MTALTRIKLKISRGEFAFSSHSIYDKLELYNFTADDILNCVFTCQKVIKQTGDERGTRYVIIGCAIDGTPIEVVCRFMNGIVYFITIYDYDH